MMGPRHMDLAPPLASSAPFRSVVDHAIAIRRPDRSERREALATAFDAATNVSVAEARTEASRRGGVQASPDESTRLLPQRASTVTVTVTATRRTVWQRIAAFLRSAARCICFCAKRSDTVPENVPDTMLDSYVVDDRHKRESWIGDREVPNGQRAWRILKEKTLQQIALDIQVRCVNDRADLADDFDVAQGSVSEQLYRLIERTEVTCDPLSFKHLVPGFYASEADEVYKAARAVVQDIDEVHVALARLFNGIVLRDSVPDWGHFDLLHADEPRVALAWPADVRAERMLLSAIVVRRLSRFAVEVAYAASCPHP